MGWSDRHARGATALLGLLGLLLLPLPARAQTVAVEGAVDHPAAALLREIAARGDYRVLDRDTVLPAGTDLAQDLVVVDARVALEGTVRGAVAVVHGALFLRPGSRVTGPVAEIGGDLLPSGGAAHGERRPLPATVRSRVEAVPGGYRVALVAPARPPLLTLPRLLGATVPTFDRVDGFTVGWGLALNPGRDTAGIRLHAEGLYRTERRDWGGRAGAEAPLGRGIWLSLGAARATFTQDAWIRDDLSNSAAALGFRSDARDYYESDRAVLALERRPTRPLQAGEGFVGPRLGVLLSRDRSLRAGDPWTFTDRDERWRPNPAVDSGTVASAFLGATLGWRGRAIDLAGDLNVEWAPGAVGDFEFAQLTAGTEWAMPGLWGHAIAVRARALVPLGGRAAPRQRYGHVGGPGTLPTLAQAYFRGDRLAFVESRYLVPLRPLSLPVVGTPALRLQHAAGAAWRTGTPQPRWAQTLGAGVQASIFEAMVYVDPADDELRPELNLGATLPGF